jgi:hypothetical protein
MTRDERLQGLRALNSALNYLLAQGVELKLTTTSDHPLVTAVAILYRLRDGHRRALGHNRRKV